MVKLQFICKLLINFQCALLFNFLLQSGEALRLNEFIGHYEPLTFDHGQLHEGHQRVRRWVNEGNQAEREPELRFHFEAHGLTFNVTLRRDRSVFGEHFELGVGNGEVEPFVQNLHLFEGVLEGVPGSHVYGAIRNGIFDGKIATPDETFYIESSQNFGFKLNPNSSSELVIYKERDVDLNSIFDPPSGSSLNSSGVPCGDTSDVGQWMRTVQNSRIRSTDPEIPKSSYLMEMAYFHHSSLPDPHNDHSTYSLAREFSHRSKRQVINSKTNQRTTCTLHIRTDPMLWRYIAKLEGMDKSLIHEEILSIIGQHVKAANEIFANSRFEGGKSSHKNIQFLVRRVKIDSYDECLADYTGPPNPFCVENVDVSNYLDMHSRTNYDDFCLSYTFTYRDFSGGVVGLAWVASPDNTGAAGGICERFSGFSDFTSKRSLNTGIITFLNYNRRLPPKISQLTFTHELGHNFGSPHDSDGECQPGGKLGNFLMYSSSTNGYLLNNDKFSPCSVKSIGLVLDKMFGSTSSKNRNCFEDTQSAFCGNQIVEEGEECDCGYNNEECTDKCCIPRHLDNANSDGSLRSQKNVQACKRSSGSQCSPSEGPCCETECNFSPRSEHQLKLCEMETECTERTFCSGKSAQCPVPENKLSNETLCNNGTQVCIDGVCRGSLCIKYGFEECYLQHEEYPDKSTLCDLACLNSDGKCVSISTLNVTMDWSTSLKLRPGTPCDNFRGYCDVFQKCRAVDQKGPLLRLTKIFFNKGTYRNAVDWVKQNPWWSGAILFAFILFMALFVKCCAVHTPSNNPNLPQHLKFAETLQRPIKTLQRRRGGDRSVEPPPPSVQYEMGPARGHRKPGPRPLPSDRASMVPYH